MTPDEALIIKKAKDNLEAAELLIGQGFVELRLPELIMGCST